MLSLSSLTVIIAGTVIGLLLGLTGGGDDGGQGDGDDGQGARDTPRELHRIAEGDDSDQAVADRQRVQRHRAQPSHVRSAGSHRRRGRQQRTYVHVLLGQPSQRLRYS